MEFKQNSRIGNDKCDLSQRAIQNKAAVSYMVDPTGQPTSSGLQFGLNNQIQVRGINSIHGITSGALTKPKSKITLQPRQFVTVPYLGKGRHDVDVETQLLTHKWESNRKSINPMSEESFIDHLHTPLVNDIKSSISNPKYLVEEVALKEWRRGGVSSRDLARDLEKEKRVM